MTAQEGNSGVVPAAAAAAAAAVNDDETDRIERWKEEQRDIAQRVKIGDDPPDESSQATKDDQIKVLRMSLDRLRNGQDQGQQEPPSNTKLLFGGVDVSFPSDESDQSVAVYVIVDEDSNTVYKDHVYFDLTVPYVSSYLAFREIDPLLELVNHQRTKHPNVTPSIILVDGNGRLHARRAGIACFLGVKTGIPTIGVGKTLYCEGNLTHQLVDTAIDEALDMLSQWTKGDGMVSWCDGWEGKALLLALSNGHNQTTDNDTENNSQRRDGDISKQSTSFRRENALDVLRPRCCGVAIKLCGLDGEELACAMVGHGGRAGPRTVRGSKNPVFVSVGHKIGLEEATRICAVLSLAKIPEPVRQADLWGRELLRQKERNKSA